MKRREAQQLTVGVLVARDNETGLVIAVEPGLISIEWDKDGARSHLGPEFCEDIEIASMSQGFNHAMSKGGTFPDGTARNN